jgi:hypothetical protein
MATLTPEVPSSLIQICETHPDREFQVSKKGSSSPTLSEVQELMPRWNLSTYTIPIHHPLAIWLWFTDMLFRGSPDTLRQRIFLEQITEWQKRCSTLDFPRTFSKKKAIEGLCSMKPDLTQAKAVMIAMERYMYDTPILWILLNEKDKKISFLDDKSFPKEGGYTHKWIVREPYWDRAWDASDWSSEQLTDWLQQQEAKMTIVWTPVLATETYTSMVNEFEQLGVPVNNLSKTELRDKLSRIRCIRKLSEKKETYT